MNCGSFYFIKDQYYIDFPDGGLQINKEIVQGQEHNRPCYYAISDNINPSIYWVIPISSKVSKYEILYNHKVAKSKYGECDTIHFGHVLGKRKAFLIQNMCPIIDEYINNEYIDNAIGAPVMISSKIGDEIVRKAKKVLMLHKRGIKGLIFPDVSLIEKQLLTKLSKDIV